MNTQLRDLMNVIITLSDLNAKAQKRFSEHNSSGQTMDALTYASELQTVRVSSGRQTGKTTAMIMMCEDQDLIIVGRATAKSYLMQRLNIMRSIASPTVVTVSEMPLKLKSFNRVWVDEPRFVDMHRVYHALCGICNQFILLG